jgi:hypothetical protein
MRALKSILIIVGTVVLISISNRLQASLVINGMSETKKATEKYSLKNFSLLTHKTATFYTLRSNLEYKGFASTSPLASTNNNYLQYNKGNISYIIPYRYKVVLSKFKTPTQP